MAYSAELDQQTYRIEVHPAGDALFTVEIDGASHLVDAHRVGATTFSLLLDHQSLVAEVSTDGELMTVSIAGEVFRLRILDERRKQVVLGEPEEEKGRREIRSQMHGKVVDVLVQVGDGVVRDQGLLIVEAMKMENELKAPVAGTVTEVRVQPGQAVETNQILVVVDSQ